MFILNTQWEIIKKIQFDIIQIGFLSNEGDNKNKC